MNRLLWGGGDEQRKMHFVSWNSISLAIGEDALSIPALSSMNFNSDF